MKNIHPIRNASSLRSMECQFALHSIRVLNWSTRTRPGSRFPFANVIRRVRGRLPLMLAAAADATATPAPARLHRFTNVPLGVPFASARTRRASQVIERFQRDPTIQVGG